MVVSQDVTTYVKSRAGPETRAYRTVPLHDSYGLYTLRVYPSKDTQDGYTSRMPAVFTFIVAVVFVFTAMVFIAFNFWVERRQKIVTERAVNSGLIVDSLFPKQVQGRLLDSEPEARDSNTWKEDLKRKITRRPAVTKEDVPVEEVASKQIADFFPEATIMFGDLSGFTHWSSTRTPCEVFDLLETIYNAFDKIALRRKVFKVETVRRIAD